MITINYKRTDNKLQIMEKLLQEVVKAVDTNQSIMVLCNQVESHTQNLKPSFHEVLESTGDRILERETFYTTKEVSEAMPVGIDASKVLHSGLEYKGKGVYTKPVPTEPHYVRIAIEKVKQGDFVRMIKGNRIQKETYTRGEYSSIMKMYLLNCESDISESRYLKKGTIVAHGFDY